jgi:bifunctional non-homologous end joining protein LigD
VPPRGLVEESGPRGGVDRVRRAGAPARSGAQATCRFDREEATVTEALGTTAGRCFGRDIEVTNADRLVFPAAGITKGQLVRYYVRIAETMLPHLHGRPVALKRYPRGLAGDGFFQKNAGPHYPGWIRRDRIPKREGGTLDHVVVDEPATLVYLANQGTIEFHPWLARADDLEHPVEIVFDLDPPPAAPVAVVRAAARQLRALLDELDLPHRLKTSGSAGYHIHLPLDGSADWQAVGRVADRLATTLVARYPDALTTRRRKAARGERVLLDWFRTGYGQTSVAAYSVRARPGAPVATPIGWDELGRVAPRTYGVRNLFRRLGQRDDPWAAPIRSVAAAEVERALDGR